MDKRKLAITRPTLRTARILIVPLMLLTALTLVALDMSGRRIRPHTPTPPPAATPSYGIAVGDSLNSTDHKGRMRMLNDIHAAGFSQVRLNLDWNVIQPTSGKTYSWKRADSIMNDVRSSGLQALVTLDRTPGWARQPSCSSDFFCPPAEPTAFAAFAANTATRYRDYPVDAWEIWNEQNIVNFWKPQPNAASYATLLQASYTAIKKQAPHATVLIGGLAGNALDSNGVGYIDPRTYLADLYEQGARQYFDGVAYHPYTGLRLPSAPSSYNGWLKMADTNPSLRSIMVDNHDQHKGIWLTEFGLPTSGSGQPASNLTATSQVKSTNHVTPDGQAAVAQAALESIKHVSWIRSFDWYTYTDNRLDPDSSGGSFGLVRANGEPKPAYYIFKRFLN